MKYKKKGNKPDKETFNRLQSYFNALDNDDLEKYHKDHGRVVE